MEGASQSAGRWQAQGIGLKRVEARSTIGRRRGPFRDRLGGRQAPSGWSPPARHRRAVQRSAAPESWITPRWSAF